MPKPSPAAPPLIIAAPDLARTVERWRRQLGGERRLAAKTVEAYSRDVGQFLAFLTGHLGGAPKLADLKSLATSDLRAFLAARRNTGAGSRTLARGLAGIRSLVAFLEREEGANGAALRAVRSPRQRKTLPKPLAVAAARQVIDAENGLDDGAMDRGAECRGAGAPLRLGPAHLGGAVAPSRRGAARAERCAPHHRQGQQAAHRPGAAAGGGGDRRISPPLPLSAGAGGAALPRRARRAAQSAHRPAGDGQAPRRPRPAGDARRRTRSAIPSPRISSRPAAISARSRSCSATPACRRRRSTPRSTRRG